MQIIQKLKRNKRLFYFLANFLYKFFNIIERNDLIKIHDDPKIYRVLDIYDTLNIDVLCDDDPSPIRTRHSYSSCKLQKKFFKDVVLFRSEKHDNGWRLFGDYGKLGFYNFNTKEVLQHNKNKGDSCK